MQESPLYTENRLSTRIVFAQEKSLIQSSLHKFEIIRLSISIVVAFLLMLISQTSFALSIGMAGYSGNPATNGGATCTACHIGGVAPTMSISGPSSVTVNSTNTYTVTMSGGQALQGGLAVSVDNGVLSDAGNPDVRIDSASGELLHSQTVNGSVIEWTFTWQAPASIGSANMYITVVSANGDGDLSGDNAASSVMSISVNSAANQAPVANIQAPIAGVEGVAVIFDATASTDSDGLITSYNWDFADGTTDSGSIVSHIFALGNYTVTLTVIDDAGLESTATHQLSILLGDQNLKPIASTGGPYQGVVGIPLSMDSAGSVDADGVINRFLWDFGDNSAFAEGAIVTHIYNTIGNYTLTLAATDNDGLTGASATTVTIIDGIPPIADSGGPYSGEVGLAINFDASASTDSDGTLVAYSWDFGDGTTSAGVVSSHIYASAGTYTVTLSVTDNDGLIASTSTTADVILAPSSTLGQTLYDDNCASCHGPGGTGGAFVAVTGASAAFITSSISGITSMNNINLSATEIQAIADYLAGSTGGGTPTKPTDGQGLYNLYCSVCHGVDGVGGPDGSVTGASAEKINKEISNTTEMQNLSNLLTSSEVDLISAFLNGLPSGGTGGGGTTPTTGQALYDAECAACHGPGGSGGAFVAVTGASAAFITSSISGISSMNNINLSATEIQAIADYLAGSTGGGTGGGGTTPTTGQALYDAECAACHGAGGSGGAFVAVTGASAAFITSSISGITSMNNINLSATEIQAIADYLAGSTGGGTPTKPTDGQGLYNLYCSVCHGVDGVGGPDGSVTGASASKINSEISNTTEMQYLSSALTSSEVDLISAFLNGLPSGGTGGGGTTPTTGQALYDAECAACHGPGGSGGAFVAVTGASAAFITSSISGISSMNNINLSATEIQAIADYLAGSTGGGTGGGGTTPTTGQALYDAECAACHGAGGSGGAFVAVTGASAAFITSSISGITSMNNINLSATEIQAIADYLAGSTGGGTTTKPTDGQGLYNLFCAACHGVDGVGGPDGSVTGASASKIENEIDGTSEMQYLGSVLTNQDVDLISNFLSSGGD